MKISDNLKNIEKNIPEQVTLIAVSKNHPIASIQEAYNAGQRVFGENKVQELCEKETELPKDIQWHFIGHLQSNKIKYIAPFVHLIHAVDSLKLLKEIDKQGQKNNRIIPYLLQIKIAEEDTKFGLSIPDLEIILAQLSAFPNCQLKGFMGMATNTTNTEQIGEEFKKIQSIFNTYKDDLQLNTLSIGMSNDYHIAIKNGSTMVRIGSAIFGNRIY